MRSLNVGLVVFGLLVLLAYMCLFTVRQDEIAIRFQFGEIIDSNYDPGLHFKLPAPVNTVVKFDKRLQTLDAEPERFLTSEKKNVQVDYFIQWRIADPKRFFTAVSGDVARANQRLDQIIKDSLRSEFGRREIKEVVSGDRSQIMQNLLTTAKAEAPLLGIEVFDVRIKRIDLPAEVSESVFARMRAERERVARDFRSRGLEAAERIRADADRERTVILAEAYRDAEATRGEGDAKAADAYASAYGKDAEFFRFYRSLSAYRGSFGDNNDILVLQPKDSEFFKYFNAMK